MELCIRSYDDRDRAAVGELFAAGLLLYADQPGQVRQEWLDHIDACLHDDLANIEGVYFGSGGHFWVATDDASERIVGMVGLEKKDETTFELRRLSVHADYRCRGIARKLVQHLEYWAKAHGATRVWLSSGSPMTKAHAFYTSIGYACVKTEALPSVEMLFFAKALE